jgi:hypothetical protein
VLAERLGHLGNGRHENQIEEELEPAHLAGSVTEVRT